MSKVGCAAHLAVGTMHWEGTTHWAGRRSVKITLARRIGGARRTGLTARRIGHTTQIFGHCFLKLKLTRFFLLK